MFRTAFIINEMGMIFNNEKDSFKWVGNYYRNKILYDCLVLFQ